MKAYFSRGRSIAFGLFALFSVILVVLALLSSNGWKSVQPAFYLLSVALVVLSGGVLAVLTVKFFVKSNTARRIATGILSGLLALVLLIVLFFGGFAAALGHSEHYIFISPSGQNRLVVIEGGYIDAVIHAYPIHGMLYQWQDNGYLSYHDIFSTWKGRLIQVEWISDVEAIVSLDYKNYMLNQGSNENHQIYVSF